MLCLVTIKAQNIGIGTSKPAASAILELSSTKQGFLPPRLTLAQRDSLKNPEIGLMIYCTTCSEIQLYNETGWKRVDGTEACRFLGNSVTICSQVWMNKNLDVSTYRNGDPIPEVKDAAQWRNLTTGAWCWYNNDSATYAASYGKLYNWYAVNDQRGLAPIGWHVPAVYEFNKLRDCLGNDTLIGGKLKESGTAHWQSPNTDATNITGFTALPGGYRQGSSQDFRQLGLVTYFWTKSPGDGGGALTFSLTNNDSRLSQGESPMKLGFSVRCVRD